MIAELDISSIIATTFVFGFVVVVYRYEKSLLAERAVGSLMLMYTFLLSLLTSLFCYLLFHVIFGVDGLEAGVPAFVIGLGLGCFMDAWEFGDDGPTTNSFLGEKIAEGKFWALLIMTIAILVLFISIFTLQSHWTYGIYWFAGAIGGALVLNFLINKSIRVVTDAMGFFRAINGMED